MKDDVKGVQLCLSQLIHGYTNMESGVISCYEWGWNLKKIAATFRTGEEKVKEILMLYGFWRKKKE